MQTANIYHYHHHPSNPHPTPSTEKVTFENAVKKKYERGSLFSHPSRKSTSVTSPYPVEAGSSVSHPTPQPPAGLSRRDCGCFSYVGSKMSYGSKGEMLAFVLRKGEV